MGDFCFPFECFIYNQKWLFFKLHCSVWWHVLLVHHLGNSGRICEFETRWVYKMSFRQLGLSTETLSQKGVKIHTLI